MDSLRRLLRAVLGDLQWSPPPWLRRLARPLVAADALRRREPGRFWSAAAALAVLAGGLYGLQRWIESRPKPAYLAVSVDDPEATALEKDAKPHRLQITFSGAAAPRELVGKEVKAGFSVSPPIAGTWRWENDRTLVFEPAAEWPVGQRYRLELERGFTAPQALLATRTIEFHAPAISASVASREFYEDPTDPKNKRVVIAIQFSHPVDKASLEKRLALRMRIDPQRDFDERGTRALGFKLSFDDWSAKAFVQSEVIAVPEQPGAVQLRLDKGVLAARGGEGTADTLTAEVAVPGIETYFRVENATASVVTNPDHRMERVVTLEFTAPVRVDGLRPSITVFELPEDRPAIGDQPEEQHHAWRDAEVVPEVLAKARKLDVTWLPSEPEWSKLQSFRFEATPERALYVRVEKGTPAYGDYLLAHPFAAVVRVEPYPRTVEILHDGSLLALSGARSSRR